VRLNARGPLARGTLTAVSVPAVVLRLELQNVEPLIWRVIRVPGDLRLSQLHRVLQTVMGWGDRYPHAFETCGRTNGTTARRAAADGTTVGCSDGMTITEALAAGRDGITYLYDHEPEWRLRVTRAPGAWRSVSKSPITCLDGYLAGPRDDHSGPAAYSAILAATLGRGPRLTRAQIERLGPGFDPELFDRSAINRELALLGSPNAV
jgi:hypothetical protein